MARTSATRRKLNNLLINGDFEYAPTFVAVQTSNAGGRWVDGTAAGSTTTNVYGWGVSAGGTYELSFATDFAKTGTTSFKISLKAAGASVQVGLGIKGGVSTANTLNYGIRVLPSTSYTLTAYQKTNLVSGSASTGALLQVVERTGDGVSTAATNSTTGVLATADWTLKTLTFTTAATTRYVIPIMTVTGNDGAGTLILDSWYDDIQFGPTTALARSVA